MKNFFNYFHKINWDRVLKPFLDGPYLDPLLYLFYLCIVGFFWSIPVLAGDIEGSTTIALYVLPLSILMILRLWYKSPEFDKSFSKINPVISMAVNSTILMLVVMMVVYYFFWGINEIYLFFTQP